MLAIQRPMALFSPSPAFSGRSNHSRNPSAPVVVRPTHTPGLLSLSKPAQQPANRQQQTQPYARAPRSATKGKQQRSSQPAPVQSRPVEDLKKSSEAKPRTDSSSPKAPKSVTAVPPSEKSIRGRQASKPAAKDKADRRYTAAPTSVPLLSQTSTKKLHVYF